MCRFSWCNGHAIYGHALCCKWMTALFQCAHPPIHTWNHLLPLSFPYAPSTSSNAPCCFWATTKVLRLTRCPSFMVSLSTGHCLSSMVTRYNDLIIILHLSVITSCNWFYHCSVSSFEFNVQDLSCSHEILPLSVGLTILVLCYYLIDMVHLIVTLLVMHWFGVAFSFSWVQ